MKYTLESAKKSDIEMLKKYKLASILDYAINMDNEEKIKIEKYVNENISKQLNDYKIIKIDNNNIGCLLIENFNDGILLDEIYLEEKFRGKKIGTNIINDVLNDHNIVYLWVYKNNKDAIKLYKRLGFKEVETTESRIFMKFEK